VLVSSLLSASLAPTLLSIITASASIYEQLAIQGDLFVRQCAQTDSRETTHVENLEKSVNSKVVRAVSGKNLNQLPVL